MEEKEMQESVPCVECGDGIEDCAGTITATGYRGRNGIKDGLYHARCWSVRKWMENEKEVS